MDYLLTALAGGAAAFAHCLGMCGGFVLHLSRGRRGRAMARQGLWLAGKTVTYVFLGALAAYSGLLLGAARPGWLEKALAWSVGGVMILMGLAVLGLRPVRLRVARPEYSQPCAQCPGHSGPGNPDDVAANSAATAPDRDVVANTATTAPEETAPESGFLAGLFRPFIMNPSPLAALGLGILSGFLPCPIVLAFLAKSVQTASVGQGMAIMAAMGLGTAWSLLLLGLTGQMIGQRLRRWGAVLAGLVLIGLGAVTALRATPAFHAVLGCDCHPPAASAPAGDSGNCCHSQPAGGGGP